MPDNGFGKKVLGKKGKVGKIPNNIWSSGTEAAKLIKMKNLSRLSFVVLLVWLAIGVQSQTKPDEVMLTRIVETSGESVENGIFRPTGGRFSIAIPVLPQQRIPNVFSPIGRWIKRLLGFKRKPIEE